ncbi:MAG: serine O-acetyltransferase [Methylocella sp.]
MPDRFTWAETRSRLRRDRVRLQLVFKEHELPVPRWLRLHPSYQSVFFYRISHYFFRNGHRLLARFFWHLNLLLTGADIAPLSEIGPGFVIAHPISTQIFGRAGADCTFWGYGGIGGGRSNKDNGGGPGLPIIGNHVTLGPRALVLGPVVVGDGCEIGAGRIVMQDLPPHTKLDIIGDADDPPDRAISPAAETSRAPQRLALGHGELLEIVRSVRPAITASELDLPVSEASLDSLDLAIVRSAIEVQLGHPVSDELWYASNTLAEMIETR